MCDSLPSGTVPRYRVCPLIAFIAISASSDREVRGIVVGIRKKFFPSVVLVILPEGRVCFSSEAMSSGH